MKYVYLDQMKWIDLAKAEVGKPDGKRFVALLRNIKEAVYAGAVCFPISATMMMETARSVRPDQRETLASLMSTLSAGWVLRGGRYFVTEQLDAALCRLYDLPSPIRVSGVSTDPTEAFGPYVMAKGGFDSGLSNVMRWALSSPEGWRELLSYQNDEERRRGESSARKIADKGAEDAENVRTKIADESFEIQERIYAARIMVEFLPQLNECIRTRNLDPSRIEALGPEGMMTLTKSVPWFDIELNLTLQRDRQKSRPVHRNDSLDIAFLCVAIPYCDVLVTERFWSDLIIRRRLDQKYDTLVVSSLLDLEPYISAL